MNAKSLASRALEILEVDVRAVREAMLAAEVGRAAEIAVTHPAHRRSAANLVHYVELRNHDVRDLQARLAAAGLSSLGRSEAHVMATTEEVLSVLARLNGNEPPSREAAVAFTEGNELLEHVRATTRPSGPRPWVAMDLGGPKLRTGPLRPGPRAMRISPKRDRLGVVTEPRTVWLTASPDRGVVPAGATAVPIVDAGWLGRRHAGDNIELVDSRGAERRWDVTVTRADGCLVTATQTAYLCTGLEITCPTADGRDSVEIGELPEVEQAHRVNAGDHLTLTRTLEPAPPTESGHPHRIGCTLAEVFEQAKPGERVWFDDGKIGGVIVRVSADEIDLRVTDVRPGGAKLKAGKGINFPDTDLRLDALTGKDLEDLDFVARHADLVNMSFVRRPADVEHLQEELDHRDAAEAQEAQPSSPPPGMGPSGVLSVRRVAQSARHRRTVSVADGRAIGLRSWA